MAQIESANETFFDKFNFSKLHKSFKKYRSSTIIDHGRDIADINLKFKFECKSGKNVPVNALTRFALYCFIVLFIDKSPPRFKLPTNVKGFLSISKYIQSYQNIYFKLYSMILLMSPIREYLQVL